MRKKLYVTVISNQWWIKGHKIIGSDSFIKSSTSSRENKFSPYLVVGRWSLSHDAMCDIPCIKFDIEWLRQDRCMKWRVKIHLSYFNFLPFSPFYEMRARSIWTEALHCLFLSIESCFAYLSSVISLLLHR